MFKDDQTGNMSIKLEVLPMPKMGKDGFPEVWLNVFVNDKFGGDLVKPPYSIEPREVGLLPNSEENLNF